MTPEAEKILWNLFSCLSSGVDDVFLRQFENFDKSV
jgi:hypothetical protein